MRKIHIGLDVFDAAVRRIEELYSQGHRVVCSMSGGKDSGTCLELCILAAERAGKLPVDAIFREEEILYPGTHDYLRRIAQRPEVKLRWVVAHQPMVNVFDRASPYWWICDKRLDPGEWLVELPPYAESIAEQHIEAIVSPKRFPVADGQELIDITGIRASESTKRLLGLITTGGHLTTPKKRDGSIYRKVRPIYDWTDHDVWRATKRCGWDYNRAYDSMFRIGVSARSLRIGPVTMNRAAAKALTYASKLWPAWFDRVCGRLRGVRQAAQFGDLVTKPRRRVNETWQECFERTCVNEAAAPWIAERSVTVRDLILARHRRHSTEPLPDIVSCGECKGTRIGSWKSLAMVMFNGDPFSNNLLAVDASKFKALEPEFFRDGAGRWSGDPTW